MVIQDKKQYRLKCYPRGYKKRLKRINKRRERLNTNRYINNIFDEMSSTDLELSEFFTDAYGHEYHMFEHNDWMEYLGRDWSLENELDYCDKIYENWQPEDDYNFTDKEVEYAVNSWNKGQDRTELDPIQRAMNAFQAVKDWQEAWRKHGIIGVVKLYFNIGNKDNNN